MFEMLTESDFSTGDDCYQIGENNRIHSCMWGDVYKTIKDAIPDMCYYIHILPETVKRAGDITLNDLVSLPDDALVVFITRHDMED